MRLRVTLEGNAQFEVYTSPRDRTETTDGLGMFALFDFERLPLEPDKVKHLEAWDVGAFPVHWLATTYSREATGVLVEFERIP